MTPRTAKSGQSSIRHAGSVPSGRRVGSVGAVAELGQGGAAVAQPRLVGPDEAHDVGGHLEAVSLGGERGVEGLVGSRSGTRAPSGAARNERGPGEQDRCRGHGAGRGGRCSGSAGRVPGALGTKSLGDHEGELVAHHGEVVGVGDADAAARPVEDAHRRRGSRRWARPAIMAPTTSGSSTSASLARADGSGTEPSGATDGWALSTAASSTGQIEGWKPHRFIDTGVSPGSTAGSRPSPTSKAPSVRRVTPRRSTRRSQVPVGPHRAGAAGHRGVGHDGVAQSVGHDGVVVARR